MALHLIVGFVVGAALTWPRVTPQAIYYGDMQRHLVHADDDCPYSRAPTFGSLKESRAANLKECPYCLPDSGQQVAYGHGDDGQNDTDNDVRPIAKH